MLHHIEEFERFEEKGLVNYIIRCLDITRVDNSVKARLQVVIGSKNRRGDFSRFRHPVRISGFGWKHGIRPRANRDAKIPICRCHEGNIRS